MTQTLAQERPYFGALPYPDSVAIYLSTLKGGALANNATAMATGFLRIGVKQVYLVYLHSEPGSHVAVPEGVHLVSLQAKRSATSILALTKFLRRKRPNYFIAMSTIMSIPAIVAWGLSGRIGTKFIISEHSTLSYKVFDEYKHDMRFKLMPFLTKRLYPKVAGLRTNSPDVLEDLIGTMGIGLEQKKTAYIPNPVNIEAIRRASRLAPQMPLPGEEKATLISVGRLAKQKNYPLLLEAFSDLKKQVDARLIILGEGPERSKLEQLRQRLGLTDVYFLGFKENPWAYMAQADVFVLASEEETFGLVLVEAMACGLPIVATDALGGGPREVLAGGKYGLLVPSNAREALTKAMLRLLTSAGLQQNYARAGQERCEAYSPEKIAERWLTFFQTLNQADNYLPVPGKGP